MSVSLVVMAAGLGSRFGGTKQLAVVGPDGEAFLDFAIRDAIDAGVERVVLIIRSDIDADVRRHVESQHPHLDVAYVRQDEHGPPRDKPWGTAHAVLTVAGEVSDSFIVCNADDYYGRSTFLSVAPLAEGLAPDRALLAGFRLERTLPEVGEVTRGICTVETDQLIGLVETHGIGWQPDGSIAASDPEGPLAADAVASMNFWAFSPQFFDDLRAGYDTFLSEHGTDESAEYLLPWAVQDLMAKGGITVGVVPTEEPWVGVTNPDDLEVARQRIVGLRSGG